jgi:hypothetical protein
MGVSARGYVQKECGVRCELREARYDGIKIQDSRNDGGDGHAKESPTVSCCL